MRREMRELKTALYKPTVLCSRQPERPRRKHVVSVRAKLGPFKLTGNRFVIFQGTPQIRGTRRDHLRGQDPRLQPGQQVQRRPRHRRHRAPRRGLRLRKGPRSNIHTADFSYKCSTRTFFPCWFPARTKAKVIFIFNNIDSIGGP